LIEAAHACRLRVNSLYQYEDGWHAKVNDGRPSGCDAEKHMATSERRAVTVLLTDEHLRKMTEDHLLKENETGDRVKVARIVQKLLDTGLGLPDRPWHDWDEWVKGLE
jgi:hypothetical protein